MSTPPLSSPVIFFKLWPVSVFPGYTGCNQRTRKWKETRAFTHCRRTKLFRVSEKCWDSIWSLVEDIWSICGNWKKCLRLSWMLLVRDKFLIKSKIKVVTIKISADLSIRLPPPMPLYILVMSHDNDNARSFAAAAACGAAAVTPLISTWPTSASHTWLDWTQSKKRNDPCAVHLVMLHIWT